MHNTSEEIIESWRDMMDVPMKLNIELGNAKLTMQDVLKLQLDSVVKLSRSTGEGVVVMADDRTLVRGEIVVIEDRAGVRVTEIVADEN
jgi:flagellar motor switch protein FliN/FliY